MAITLLAPPLLGQDKARFLIDTPSATLSGIELLALDKGALTIKDEPGPRVLARLIGLRREGATLPELPTLNSLCLTNGDRLPLDPEASAVLEENRLKVWPGKPLADKDGKPASFYVPHVVQILWSLPEGVDDAELFFARLERASRKNDIVLLRNGDRIEGTVTALTGKDGCTIAAANRKVQVPWSKLAGIAWNTERAARLSTKKSYWRATLEGGGRINVLDVSLDEKTRRWHGVTQWGAALALPESSLLALDERLGQAIDLVDLPAALYEHQPFLDISWPLARDTGVTGHALKLGGSTYERGLGMHAPSKVVYQLDGQYQRFLAQIGIDDRAKRGRAKVALELDGKRIDVNDGKELTSQSASISVGIDVKGARSLTLIAELGSFGDVQAHVNWANARLIKKD